jgi:hypothetical protein
MAVSIVPDRSALPLRLEGVRIVVKIHRAILPHFDPSMQGLTARELSHHALRKSQTALATARQAVGNVLFGAVVEATQNSFFFAPPRNGDAARGPCRDFGYSCITGIEIGEEQPPVLELVADGVVDGVAVFRAGWLDGGAREHWNRKANSIIKARIALALRY